MNEWFKKSITKYETGLVIYQNCKFGIEISHCWKTMSRQDPKIKILALDYESFWFGIWILNFGLIIKFDTGKL